ncbi:unnamed protein product [Microthlaspi erraticum]|uniref:Uncharacterized protein n=1 Tax=Microthlaspi erraticum TaxID=1685480 RepID=A0A6D2IT00_9BRAS|nr:unnamed protein product [Microthlaspi erraticum]
MFALSSTMEDCMNYITEDVISEVRYDLVDSGKLEETVLRELQATWKRKMKQAGLISSIGECSYAPIPIPTHTPLQTPDPNSLYGNFEMNGQSNPSMVMDLMASPKREHEGFFIPQQDGANDGDFKAEANTSNDEDDEETLNENDDEEEPVEDDKDIPHLVMCQFDSVKRSKNKWDCKFKSGVMKINDKNIIFSKADGVFNF